MAKPRKKIFFISPVNTDVGDETRKKIEDYVKRLEEQGYSVHWPIRDTEQNDPTGGIEICLFNFQKMCEADEIYLWYVPESRGIAFDMGGGFMWLYLNGIKSKKIVLLNEREIIDSSKKSIFKVFQKVVEKQNSC